MSSTSTEPPSNNVGERDGTKAEKESLTDCMLSQYRLCAAGIGLGTAYSLKYKKGFVPMVAAGAVGTTADMVYAYLVECAHLADDNSSTTMTTATTNPNDTSSTKEFNDT